MKKTNKIKVLKATAYIWTIILLITTLIHYHLAEQEEELTETKESVMGSYKEATADGFIMLSNKKEIRVITPNAAPPPILGEVLAYGYLNQNTMIASGIHNYNYNYVLYALSALAGLFVIRQFFKEWKITKRGIVDA